MREFNALTGFNQVELDLRGEKYRVIDLIPTDIEGTKHREFFDLTRSQTYGENMIFRMKIFSAKLTPSKTKKLFDKFRKKTYSVSFVHVRLMNCMGCTILDNRIVLIPSHISTLKALVSYLVYIEAFGEVVEPRNLLEQTPLGGFKNSNSLQVTSNDSAKVKLSNHSREIIKDC